MLELYRIISGSRLYGLDDETSDKDEYGVYFPAVNDLLGMDAMLKGKFNNLHSEDDITFYSLHNFGRILSKGNFAALEILFAPEDKVLFCDPLFLKVLSVKEQVINPLLLIPLFNFAQHNLNHMHKRSNTPKRAALYDKCGYDSKYLANAVRIVDVGMNYLETGIFNVDHSSRRSFYLDIKNGITCKDWAVDYVNTRKQILQESYDKMKPSEEELNNVRNLLNSVIIEISKEIVKRDSYYVI
jgi:hypothetical protein